LKQVKSADSCNLFNDTNVNEEAWKL